jgi:hypothetical protein
VLTQVRFDRAAERGGIKKALEKSKYDASEILGQDRLLRDHAVRPVDRAGRRAAYLEAGLSEAAAKARVRADGAGLTGRIRYGTTTAGASWPPTASPRRGERAEGRGVHRQVPHADRRRHQRPVGRG